jgi:hypothetical protein
MDLNKLKGQRRTALINSGTRFGSATINTQIDLILGVVPDHQDALKRYGLADKATAEREPSASRAPRACSPRARI